MVFTSIADCNIANVSNADYAACNGRYERKGDLSVAWAPQRAVYKQVGTVASIVTLEEPRYLFWNTTGLGWSIGTEEGLTSGGYFHSQGEFSIVRL